MHDECMTNTWTGGADGPCPSQRARPRLLLPSPHSVAVICVDGQWRALRCVLSMETPARPLVDRSVCMCMHDAARLGRYPTPLYANRCAFRRAPLQALAVRRGLRGVLHPGGTSVRLYPCRAGELWGTAGSVPHHALAQVSCSCPSQVDVTAVTAVIWPCRRGNGGKGEPRENCSEGRTFAWPPQPSW